MLYALLLLRRNCVNLWSKVCLRLSQTNRKTKKVYLRALHNNERLTGSYQKNKKKVYLRALHNNDRLTGSYQKNKKSPSTCLAQ